MRSLKFSALLSIWVPADSYASTGLDAAGAGIVLLFFVLYPSSILLFGGISLWLAKRFRLPTSVACSKLILALAPILVAYGIYLIMARSPDGFNTFMYVSYLAISVAWFFMLGHLFYGAFRWFRGKGVPEKADES